MQAIPLKQTMPTTSTPPQVLDLLNPGDKNPLWLERGLSKDVMEGGVENAVVDPDDPIEISTSTEPTQKEHGSPPKNTRLSPPTGTPSSSGKSSHLIISSLDTAGSN